MTQDNCSFATLSSCIDDDDDDDWMRQTIYMEQNKSRADGDADVDEHNPTTCPTNTATSDINTSIHLTANSDNKEVGPQNKTVRRGTKRVCMECATDTTPQWRTGPPNGRWIDEDVSRRVCRVGTPY